MKKKLIVAGVLVYCAVGMGIFVSTYREKQVEPQIISKDVYEEVPLESVFDFQSIDSRLQYTGAFDSEMYYESDEMLLREEDKISILDYYDLPSIIRMNADDSANKMEDLQVLLKMAALGVDQNMLFYPEYCWKRIYADGLQIIDETVLLERETISFEGTKASELNPFLTENQGKQIDVIEDSILLDETIKIPSNTILNGNGAVLSAEEVLQHAILMEGVENVCIQNIRLLGGFELGIYIVDSQNVLIYRNEVANAAYKAISVMGSNSYINLVSNSVHDNDHGAVFLKGDISNCIIQHNDIYQNRGTNDLGAGMVFVAVGPEGPYVEDFEDEYLYNMLDAPHDIVVKDNKIQENYSSGIYFWGSYQCYVIDNKIEDNEKEGMCLDFGTFGSYVSRNTIARNGDRNRQSDEDLEREFVIEWGRMSDGSSKAKLPGISIDNSACNIIFNNIIMQNAGSGVKMVRSGYRNIILANTITDNNAGENDAFHGFAVELGVAKLDVQVKRLDSTVTDYENIIARNVISGHHYSGIYIGEECYCNDLIDNVILDCTMFSVENFSELYNASIGNSANVNTLNFELR